MKNMELPDPLKTRNGILKEYCEVRIKSYDLIYKTIEGNTNIYQQEIQNYNKEIERLIGELLAIQKGEK